MVAAAPCPSVAPRFGVFDGHGGAAVSRRAAQELPGEPGGTWTVFLFGRCLFKAALLGKPNLLKSGLGDLALFWLSCGGGFLEGDQKERSSRGCPALVTEGAGITGGCLSHALWLL